MANEQQEQQAQAETHGQHINEKSARENQIHAPLNWPSDEEGNPMAIVIGHASNLIPTVPFGNVNLFSGVMRPVKNEGMEEVIMAQRFALLQCEYIVGTEQRLLQWAMDPSTKIERPADLVTNSGQTFENWVLNRLGIAVPPSSR